jgi:hypothetical protein
MKTVLVLTLLLTACVSPRAIMVHEDGRRVDCHATGFGLVSGTMANNRYEACVSEAQREGFKIQHTE